MLVRLLRAWYSLRELLGHPKRLTEAQFESAGPTTQLAGSPWIYVSPNSTTGTTSTFLINTTWPRKDN